MAKQPPKSDDEIAKAALDDIQGNIHVLKTLAEYDQRYVLQRILRAIREAKGAVVLTLCILPFAAHAGTVTCAGKSYKDITYAMFYGGRQPMARRRSRRNRHQTGRTKICHYS